jgi:hypothetical protein
MALQSLLKSMLTLHFNILPSLLPSIDLPSRLTNSRIPSLSSLSSSSANNRDQATTKKSLSSQRIASYLTDSVDWNPQFQHSVISNVRAHTKRMKAYLEEFDNKMASASHSSK